MKFAASLLFCTMLTTMLPAQPAAKRKGPTYEHLMRKNKRAKIAGFSMLSVGGIMVVGGLFVNKNARHHSAFNLINDDTFGGSLLIVVGGVMICLSSLFFAKMGSYKKQANRLKMETGFRPLKVPAVNGCGSRHISQPTVSLSLSF